MAAHERHNIRSHPGRFPPGSLFSTLTSSQITHIQFLTLLFPSGLERRLIFSLLGPLAIVSSIMHVVRIHDDANLVKVAAAVQNICNATLSLLFTAALFLWGCFVNRRDAWRTDGGTAAFGVGALTLALISTALTFIYIPSRDQYPWMPGIMWAVILWQSFLGWWWWVGAGMGVGEVEELLRREEKRQEKRRLKMAKRKVRKERAQTLWKGMTGAFSSRPAHAQTSDGGDSYDSSHSGDERHGGRDGDAQTRTQGEEGAPGDGDVTRVNSRQTVASSRSGTTASGGLVYRFLNQYSAGRVLYGWYLGLRHAHLAAAREQAFERVERINQAYGPEEGGAGGGGAFGWGLGSFGIRRQQRRQRQREERARQQAAYEMDKFDHGDDDDDDDDDDDGGEEAQDPDLRKEQRERVRRKGGDGNAESLAEGVGGAEGGFGRGIGGGEVRARRSIVPPPNRTLDEGSHRPSSVWWWGPLQRWRLQDSTDYRS